MKNHALVLSLYFLSLSIAFNGCSGPVARTTYALTSKGAINPQQLCKTDFDDSLKFNSVKTVAIFPECSDGRYLTNSVAKILRGKGIAVHDFTEMSFKKINHDSTPGEALNAIVARTNSSIQEFAFSSEVQGKMPEWVLVPYFSKSQVGWTNTLTGETGWSPPFVNVSLKLISSRDGGKSGRVNLVGRRLETEPNWDMLADELVQELFPLKQQ